MSILEPIIVDIIGPVINGLTVGDGPSGPPPVTGIGTALSLEDGITALTLEDGATALVLEDA